MNETYVAGLVSVIIPTYNRADLIIETLDSIAKQTYRPIELIIVDDGSTDNTKKLLENWADKHDEGQQLRAKFLFETNKGAPAARNLGLTHSHGEFIQFLDDDDVLSPKKIEEQVSMIAGLPTRAAVYGPWRYFKAQPNQIDLYQPVGSYTKKDPLASWISGEFFVPHFSLLWRRRDIAANGPWSETFLVNQDGEYAMRFLSNDGKLVFCRSAWGYYRLYDHQDANVSHRKTRESLESRFRIISSIEDLLGNQGIVQQYAEVFSVRYAKLASRCALNYPKLAKLCLKKSRQLSSTGKLPDVFTHPVLTKLIGLTAKRRIGRIRRRLLRRNSMNAFADNNFKKISTVSSIEDMFGLEPKDSE